MDNTNASRLSDVRGTRKPGRRFRLASAALLTIGLATVSASAANVDGSPSVVEYMQGVLLIQVGGNNHYAKLASGTNCTHLNANIDTLKSWLSLSQAAVLSGKTLRIYYDSCTPTGGSSTRFITAVDLYP